IGYSRGADVLPFAANRLPAGAKARVELLALIAPSRRAEFEFQVCDWFGGASGGAAVKPELEAWPGAPPLCFYGKGEPDSLCPDLEPGSALVVALGGGHHFGGAYGEIAARILARLEVVP
ncbi:MAG: hypothetical protein PHF00_13670, partial [Elusimicrobia bacterium]|nr:hypothetical protein [Elusimicrobiota bacterium]